MSTTLEELIALLDLPKRRPALDGPTNRRQRTEAQRRKAKMLRTPRWADKAAIQLIYAQAKDISRETGVMHHVDHIIPLQGANVSGLHVEGNLQIVTASENARKKNYWAGE